VVSFIFILIGWEYLRNPISALDRGVARTSYFRADSFEIKQVNEKRKYVDVVLFEEKLDSIRITISFPYLLKKAKLPVILILGGLDIGRESLVYIPKHGNNILIAYQYPYSPRYWYDGTAFNQIPVIRESVLKVPAQVVEVIKWVSYQSWCDSTRFSTLGYSFGAMFVPAILHLAQEQRLNRGYTILAYGGADIFNMLRSNLKFLNPISRFLVAFFASTSIRPVEPVLHLPHLKGNFLLINGKDDELIPKVCWEKFQALTPEPKNIRNLNEGHMNPAKKELTSKVISISHDWLLEQGVINPF
jgi:hypothetical protein